MLWAHARRKFVEALEEDSRHASEALVYIGRLYGIEDEMREAGLDAEAIVYSLFSSCKAHGIDTCTWLEDTLKRLPSEKNVDSLLPCNLRK